MANLIHNTINTERSGRYTLGLAEYLKLECGPMPNVMAALSNKGGALCSTLQRFAEERNS